MKIQPTCKFNKIDKLTKLSNTKGKCTMEDENPNTNLILA